ncbi:MAG: LPS assembly lipoprotein LptE [Sphingomonas fennica]
MRTVAALALAAALLGGCGLRPLYAGGGAGPVAASLATIGVEAPGGRSGWLMRNALVDRLGQGAAPTTPRYTLQVELDDSIQGFGIRADSAVTRERRTLRARYRLVEAGQVLLDATAGSDAGIDVVGSEYSTIAAEQTAEERLVTAVADQIVARLALYVSRGGGGGTR